MPTRVTRTVGPGTQVLKALGEANGMQSRVGWFKTAHEPDGVPSAYVAAIHEFGYAPKNIPPRMGLRTMLRAKTGEYRTLAGSLAKTVLKGSTMYAALERLGGKVAGDVRAQIASVKEPMLAPATILARWRRAGGYGVQITDSLAKPLVDSGNMQANVTHQTGTNETLGELE